MSTFEMQQPVQRDDERQKAMVEVLFQRYAPALFAFLLQKTSSREDAEDLLLEVFTTILGTSNSASFPRRINACGSGVLPGIR